MHATAKKSGTVNPVQQAILAKKAALAELVARPLGQLAERCATLWPNADALDAALLEGIHTLPYCQLMYAWNREGIEVSSMVERFRADSRWRGFDLSQRPYLKNNLPFQGIMLSSVYDSIYTHKQCVTALQAVRRGEQLLGFIAADFAIGDLLRDTQLVDSARGWQQFRGDPSVRGTVFLQSRTPSVFDAHIDPVLARIGGLMREHGVFHSKIHFSSGRCSFWVMADPYNYRIHGVDEIIDPELCLAYPLHPYPTAAKTPAANIAPVLAQFKALRFADETIYLRSGSLNVMNGMVGLTFSCDGSHYMPVDEFLEKDLGFWVGTLSQSGTSAA